MVEQLPLDLFHAKEGILLDARSPAEHAQGEIPGSFNLPLLNDEERAKVGKMYKKKGQQEAVLLGYELVGPRFAQIVREALDAVGEGCAKIYCWRGGLRSNTLASILSTAGIPSVVLRGGYKSFRRACLNLLEEKKKIHVLGGLTGCGKTDLLRKKGAEGEQVLDLESLANHRGSSYGGIGMPPQPTTEQFENLIAMKWASFDDERPVWIEDESFLVGNCRVPKKLYDAMQKAPFFLVEKSLEERIAIIERDYGNGPKEELIAATRRIGKRLGSERMLAAIAHIEAGNIRDWILLVLEYYDKAYQRAMQKKSVISSSK